MKKIIIKYVFLKYVFYLLSGKFRLFNNFIDFVEKLPQLPKIHVDLSQVILHFGFTTGILLSMEGHVVGKLQMKDDITFMIQKEWGIQNQEQKAAKG